MKNSIFCTVIASKFVSFFFHKAYWSENYTKRINAINTSGVFRALPNIYGGAFCKNSLMLDVWPAALCADMRGRP